MAIPGLARRLLLLLAALGPLVAVACGGGHDTQPQGAVAGGDPAFRPVTGDVARQALSTVRGLYETRGEEIAAREAGGRFRLAAEGGFVTADVSYLSDRVEALLDTSRPLSERLRHGTDAVTVLIAGFRTTEMSEFGIAAHDVLDYVHALSETPSDGAIAPDLRAASLAPLEQQLKALETSCTCR